MSDSANPRSLRTLKIAAVVAVIAVLVVAHQFGIFQQFADPATVKATLVRLGPWGLAGRWLAVRHVFGRPKTAPLRLEITPMAKVGFLTASARPARHQPVTRLGMLGCLDMENRPANR